MRKMNRLLKKCNHLRKMFEVVEELTGSLIAGDKTHVRWVKSVCIMMLKIIEMKVKFMVGRVKPQNLSWWVFLNLVRMHEPAKFDVISPMCFEVSRLKPQTWGLSWSWNSTEMWEMYRCRAKCNKLWRWKDKAACQIAGHYFPVLCRKWPENPNISSVTRSNLPTNVENPQTSNKRPWEESFDMAIRIWAVIMLLIKLQ